MEPQQTSGEVDALVRNQPDIATIDPDQVFTAIVRDTVAGRFHERAPEIILSMRGEPEKLSTVLANALNTGVRSLTKFEVQESDAFGFSMPRSVEANGENLGIAKNALNLAKTALLTLADGRDDILVPQDESEWSLLVSKVLDLRSRAEILDTAENPGGAETELHDVYRIAQELESSMLSRIVSPYLRLLEELPELDGIKAEASLRNISPSVLQANTVNALRTCVEICAFDPRIGDLIKRATPYPEQMEEVSIEAARKAALFCSAGNFPEVLTELKLMYAAMYGVNLVGGKPRTTAPFEISEAFSMVVKEIAEPEPDHKISPEVEGEILSAIKSLSKSFVGEQIFRREALPSLRFDRNWHPLELYLMPGGEHLFCLNQSLNEQGVLSEFHPKMKTSLEGIDEPITKLEKVPAIEFLSALTCSRAMQMRVSGAGARLTTEIILDGFERLKLLVSKWVNREAVLNRDQQQAVCEALVADLDLIGASGILPNDLIEKSMRLGAVINSCRG